MNTEAFIAEAMSPDPGLAVAALMIARVENPLLNAGPYLEELDAWGREATVRVAAARAGAAAGREAYAEVAAVSDFVFRELGFVGNERQYEDPRNSFLNEVLDRRTGIPITLALVYMEVARRAGVNVSGVNFPGRFLLRSSEHASLIIDPFGGGTLLTEARCRELFHEQAGAGDEVAEWNAGMLAHATKPQILLRMLLNLKRSYVRMYSFPQARNVMELLLALDPSAVHELRDRGLLAYHLNDFSGALRDLQAYLQLSAPPPKAAAEDDEETRHDEHAEIWEHVKTLRRRVATFN